MPKPITSLRALAKAVGLSHVSVQLWAKRPDWPIGKGPWRDADLRRLVAWRRENLKEPAESGELKASGELSLKTKFQIKKLDAEIRLMEHNLAVRGNKFHDVAQCESNVAQIFEHVKRRLIAVTNGSPYTMEINKWFADRIREALQELSQ